MIKIPTIAFFIQHIFVPKVPFRYGRNPIFYGETKCVVPEIYSPVFLDWLMCTALDKHPVQICSTDRQAIMNNVLAIADHPQRSKEISGFIIGENILAARRINTSGALVKKESFYFILQEKYPWIPTIKEKDFADEMLRNNFMQRVLALQELNHLREKRLTRHALIDFHSRYKLLLLAHSQPAYREIGPFVALIHQWKSLEAFFIAYREKLMAILQLPTSRENHTNVLMHIQGYFRPQLSAYQRGELSCAIDHYRIGTSPIDIPLKLLKKYLSIYPNRYLNNQKYLLLEGDSI